MCGSQQQNDYLMYLIVLVNLSVRSSCCITHEIQSVKNDKEESVENKEESVENNKEEDVEN